MVERCSACKWLYVKIIIFNMQNEMVLCKNVPCLTTIKQTLFSLTPEKVVEGESLDERELYGPCFYSDSLSLQGFFLIEYQHHPTTLREHCFLANTVSEPVSGGGWGCCYLMAQDEMRLPPQPLIYITRGYWQNEVSKHISPFLCYPIWKQLATCG